MTPSQLSQWLLQQDAPFTDADRNALAVLSKTYPYFVPSRYVEASIYNADHPFAPAILNKMRLYMGDWISFHEFLSEHKPKANQGQKPAFQTDIEEYNDDEPEYFFDTYEDEQEILKTEEQHPAETIYEDDDFEEEEEDFELFNEKDSEEEPFAAFDARKERPKMPEMTATPHAPESPMEVPDATAATKTEPIASPEPPEEKTTEEEPTALSPEEPALKEEEQAAVLEEETQPASKEEEHLAEEVAIEEPPTVVQEILQEEEAAPQIEIVEEKKSAKPKQEPLIQPIYTEDYFLHQGIDAKDETVQEEKEKQLMVMMSFSDWLMHFKTRKEKQKEEEEDQKALKTMWQKEKLAAALEEENEEIPEGVFEMAVNSIKHEDDLVSESLAEIMIKQGKFDKAIEMYRKLSLRNPQKNAYFADKIEKLIKEK